MGELGKIGGAYVRRLGLSFGLSLGLMMVFGTMLCVLPVCAGLIHEDLIGPVFWCAFLSIPFVMVPGFIGGALLWRLRHNGVMDATFAPIGPGRLYLLSGRQWQGDWGARRATARIAQRTLTVSLSGSPPHDVRIGRDNALARAAGRALGVEPVDHDGLLVFSREGIGLMEQEGVAEAVAALLRDDGRTLRNLHVDPSTGVTLTLRHATLQLVETEAWLVAMEIVLGAAEGR